MRRTRVCATGLVAVLLLGAGSSTIAVQPSEFCACLELGRAAEGLSNLSRVDWKLIERSRLGEIWPPAASCRQTDELSVEEEFYGLCCGSCGTCGGQRLVENSRGFSVSVRAIGAVVCQMTEDGVRENLARLVESAIDQNRDPQYERIQLNDYVMDTYQWESGGDDFLLTSRVFEWRDWWVGRVETIRCETSSGAETWALDDGSRVAIIELSIDPEEEGERWVHLDYLTGCTLATQSSCVDPELDLVWRRLMISVDLTDIDVVSVSAQRCDSHNQTTFVKRNGDWVIVN